MLICGFARLRQRTEDFGLGEKAGEEVTENGEEKGEGGENGKGNCVGM